MKTKWKIILALSLLGNIGGVYVAMKALEYRRHINHFRDKYTYVVQEFSGRRTYEQANRSLTPDDSKRGRVVFLGSQITSGWDLEYYFADYQAINRGISGQRLAGYLLRIVPDVVEPRPKAVVVEFSSYNFRPENSVREMFDYITSIGDIARSNGIEPIYTTVVPVRSDFFVQDIDDYSVPDSLESYNEWLRSYCTQNNYRVVDFHNLLADSVGCLPMNFSTSQIQLSRAGYDLISEATLRVLDSLE